MVAEYAINPKFGCPNTRLQQQRNMHENAAVWSITWNFHHMKFELLPWRASHNIITYGLPSIFFQNNCWNTFCSLIEHSWMLPNNPDKICISTLLLPQHSRRMSLEVIFNLLTSLESCQVRPAVKIWPQVTNESSVTGAPTLQWSYWHGWHFSNAKKAQKNFGYDAVKPSLIWKWL